MSAHQDRKYVFQLYYVQLVSRIWQNTAAISFFVSITTLEPYMQGSMRKC